MISACHQCHEPKTGQNFQYDTKQGYRMTPQACSLGLISSAFLKNFVAMIYYHMQGAELKLKNILLSHLKYNF
jgi:hypothetical protein